MLGALRDLMHLTFKSQLHLERSDNSEMSQLDRNGTYDINSTIR
jgi:hypothetical protein